MSDFAGLRLALTALQSQQRGVEVAAQNVANANTEGYSRERVDLENIGAPAVPALYSTFTGSGGGVRVADVARFRDQFLEIRAALEHASGADLAQNKTTLDRIQQLFNEPSDNGLAKQLSDFWSGFDDVANHPDDTAARTQLLERADTLVASFNTASERLTQIATDTQGELGATVADINTKSQQIAQLNAAIKANTISGLDTNDLADKRDLLVNQLAEESGATVRTSDFGMVNVVLNGTALVQQDHANSLKLDTSSGTVVRWSADNSLAQVTSGKAGGELTTINSTVPSYIAKLNTVATTLRDEVNQLHSGITGSLTTAAQNQSSAGNLTFDLALNGGAYSTVTVAGADWSGAGGATALAATLQASIDAAIGAGKATASVTGGNGTPMSVTIVPSGTNTLTVRQSTSNNTGFQTLLNTTGVGTDGVGGRAFFTGTDALSFAVAPGVDGNPNAIAAGTAAGGPLDGSRALDLADLAQSLTGGDASYRQLIVQLGVDAQTATTRNQIQQSATQSLDNSRSQYSGVSIDEEMTNLVQFQHAYDAAARFMTTIDSMLDTLINHTGTTV